MTPLFVSAALLLGSVFVESALARPFTMRVVDESGHGVAHVRVVTDNGIVCYSLLDGTLSWSESSLMRRSVRFSLNDDAHAFKTRVTTMHVTRGTTAIVTLDRVKPES